MGAQAGLDVAHGYLLIEGCKSRCGACGCVAVNKNNVGLCLFQYVAQANEYACGNIVKILSLLHNVEVVIGSNLEKAKHLVEHLTVLSRYTDNGLECFGIFLELLNKGCHLYSFGTCAEYQHYFFHDIFRNI